MYISVYKCHAYYRSESFVKEILCPKTALNDLQLFVDEKVMPRGF